MNKKLPIGTIIAVPMKIVDETDKSYIAACLDIGILGYTGVTSVYIQKESLCAIPASESLGPCTIISTPEYFANAKVGDKVWAIGDDEDGYIKKIFDDEVNKDTPLRIDYYGYNSIIYDRKGIRFGESKQTLFYADDPRVKMIKAAQKRMNDEIKEIVNGEA